MEPGGILRQLLLESNRRWETAPVPAGVVVAEHGCLDLVALGSHPAWRLVLDHLEAVSGAKWYLVHLRMSETQDDP